MKKYLFLLVIFGAFSCAESKQKDLPNKDPKLVLKDFRSWWNYHATNILMAENYTALDRQSNPISRELFIDSLITGKVIAMKLSTSDSSVKYQLYPVGEDIDQSIVTQIQSFGRDEMQNLKMQGQPIPAFNFTDLNGKTYTAENTKGKIVLLKCWFIHCTVCVQEMPELNKLVRKLSNRNDVIFLSLAYDTPGKLNTFLAKTRFDYATASVGNDYMSDQLKIRAYPTHFVINKQGLIANVSTDYEQMEIALDRELAK